jgi:N-glycosylase/DNA lyase
MVEGGTTSSELRDYLINRVNGMGYKAASHFLRDIGALDLAIVDTHVLKYKPYFMPKDKQHYEPGSPKQYLEIEKYFSEWAYKEFDMAPAYLDWFIWTLESGNGITSLEY